MDDMGRFKCIAGFYHTTGEQCGHVAPQRLTRGFRVPDDYYSPERVAERREANKSKYGPTTRWAKKRIAQGNEAEGIF